MAKVKITIPTHLVEEVAGLVTEQRRTGKFVVNINQGTPCGGVQWIETEKSETPPLTGKVERDYSVNS